MFFKKTFLCAASFIFVIFMNAKQLFVHVLPEKKLERFSIVESCVKQSGTDACINKVTDGKNMYIIKQIADPSLSEQLLLATDAVCSSIGAVCDVPVNQVSFIPYNLGKHLKIYPDRAATLHTFIEGKDLESKMPLFLDGKNFTLHQRVIKKNSPWQKKYPLAENQQGLTQDIIESMSINKMLPSIVALDTFVGNADRSLPNIFYQEKNNSFYGIDLAAGLHSNLAFVSCQRIKELIKNDYFVTCPATIKNGLCMYNNTLIKLVNTIHPNVVEKMLNDLAKLLGPDVLLNQDVLEDIKHFSSKFRQNVNDVHVLISLLETVIKS